MPTRLPWRSPLAWKLTLYMGGLSIIYIVLLTWLAPRYEDLGYSDSRAALVLTVFTAGRSSPACWCRSSPATAATCAVAGREHGARRRRAPRARAGRFRLPWVWASLAGLGMGGAFPLTLTLFVIFARTPEESSRLTAMGFSSAI